ncbi:hypothetical protein DER44DRAFT_127536 [Fusarium oxysporum]|nr:hypothetical protein DER44DRAFT_127536 [Fusarium oxysporum]
MLHVWWSRPSALWRADRGLEPRHHIRALRIFPLLLLLALINSNYSLIFLFDSCSCKVLYAKLHQRPVLSLNSSPWTLALGFRSTLTPQSHQSMR